MTLQQLMYAITTADEKSINKTAQKFFVSQPAISDAIKDLEEEIGITIFDRSNRGVTTTAEGADFIVYARQVVAQYDLLKERYIDKEQKEKFGVSTQHYTFAVKSYIELISNFGTDKYEYSIYEGKTSEVINDVRTFRSEIGVIHLDEYNHSFIQKYLKYNNLEYHKLFDCKVYAYLSSDHPLADAKKVTESDLEPYPCLTFNQGEEDPIYLAEEPISMFERKKNIKVNDRGTMLNMMIGLNGYTLCSGIICEELNGTGYKAVPYESREKTSIVYVVREGSTLSELGQKYIENLKAYGS